MVFDDLFFSESKDRPEVLTWEDIMKRHPYHFCIFEPMKDNALFKYVYVLNQEQNQHLGNWLYAHNGIRDVPDYSSTFPTPLKPIDFINMVRVRDPKFYNTIVQYRIPSFHLFIN